MAASRPIGITRLMLQGIPGGFFGAPAADDAAIARQPSRTAVAQLGERVTTAKLAYRTATAIDRS